MKRIEAYLIFLILNLMLVLECAAQWEWQNPPPQGNTLNDVEFLDELSGLAVGNCGTIIKTSDGGETWQCMESGTSLHLNACSVIDQEHTWIVGDSGIILKTSDGSNWIKLCCGISERLNACHFLDEEKGWVVSDNGYILYTSNGGYDWYQQAHVLNHNLYGIFFIDENTGWVVGGNSLHQYIYHTADGGWNWNHQSPGASYGGYLCDISFIDENRGWALNSKGVVYKTFNGGNEWDKVHVFDQEFNPHYNSILFTDSLIGYATGIEYPAHGATNGIISKTLNGGLSWEETYIGLPFELFSISFIDDYSGWVVGSNGIILQTTDAGNEWEGQDCGLYQDLNKIYFYDQDHGWAVGGKFGLIRGTGATILNTTNGGQNWLVQYDDFGTSPTSEMLYDIVFADTMVGWAVGGFNFGPDCSSNCILYTNNGGSSWAGQSREDSSTVLHSVFAINSMKAWATGDNGIILHTNDGGQQWIIQQSNTDNSLDAVQFINNEVGWINGGEIILRTVDGGETWMKQDFIEGYKLSNFRFQNENTGYGVAQSGEVFITEDGGVSWDLINESSYYVTSSHIDNQGNVSIIDDYYNAYVYDKSSNVWTPLPDHNVQDRQFTSIYFTDLFHSWIAGEHGAILFHHADSIVAIEEPVTENSTYKVQTYPNPFSAYITFRIVSPDENPIYLRIYNNYGQLIDKIKIPSSGLDKVREFKWGNNDIPPGIYLYTVGNNKNSCSGKIIKL